MKQLKFKDDLHNSDTMIFEKQESDTGIFARTKIIGGYDAYKDENGITRLGETLFDRTNTIVLGGALYTLEKIFNTKSTYDIETLNHMKGVADGGPPILQQPYPKEHCVCLFGIGIGGCGDSILSTVSPKFVQREVVELIPFRYTDQILTTDELNAYWFREMIPGESGQPTRTKYWLKRFQQAPEFKVLWKNGQDDDDGTEVEADVHTSTSQIPIETFVELVLNVNKKDVREYFQITGQVEMTRINTIGLFTGIKADVGGTEPDYKDVKLFSVLTFPNEMLTLSKDLTIIYRIYTS